MVNSSSGETSVGMYKLKKAMEKSCSDLLAAHPMKCDRALAGITIWRFSSRRKVMKSLLVATWHKTFIECIPLIVVFLVASSLELLIGLLNFWGGSSQLCLVG
jgi:hypothetical protein